MTIKIQFLIEINNFTKIFSYLVKFSSDNNYAFLVNYNKFE